MVQRALTALAVALVAACRSGAAAADTPVPAGPLLVADATSGPSDPGAVFLPSAVTQRPVLRSRPRLVVPDSVTRQGIRGAVSLEYVVDTLGRVESDIRVIATDHPALVGPAKAMVAGMRYRPGRVRGRAVRVQLGTRIRIGAGGGVR